MERLNEDGLLLLSQDMSELGFQWRIEAEQDNSGG
jgi:hypothetical protein